MWYSRCCHFFPFCLQSPTNLKEGAAPLDKWPSFHLSSQPWWQFLCISFRKLSYFSSGKVNVSFSPCLFTAKDWEGIPCDTFSYFFQIVSLERRPTDAHTPWQKGVEDHFFFCLFTYLKFHSRFSFILLLHVCVYDVFVPACVWQNLLGGVIVRWRQE